MSEGPTLCPNCGHVEVARFCSNCGQNHRDYRRSLPPMLYELMREAFELDGRIVRSLKLLFAKPGQLSVEFSNNRRARYVSPVRVYLFTSIFFFFLLAQFSELDAGPQARAAAFEYSAEYSEDSVAYLRSILTDEQAAQMDEMLARDGSLVRGVIIELADAAHSNMKARGRHGPIAAFVYGQIIEVLEAPRTFLERSLENAPIAMFLLLPVYALLLKVLFLGSHKYFVEHVVYALHLHTFAFLLLAVLIVLPDELSDWLDELLGVWFAIYYFVSLRRFYGQSRSRTAVKFGVLIVVYGLLITPSIIATMLFTATQL